MVLMTAEYANQSAQDISQVCEDVRALLLEKNLKYGDSALRPSRIFSKAATIEQIYVRIDDKLTRIKNRNTKEIEDEDVVLDLIGYLILLKAHEINERRIADFVIT